MPGNSNPSQKLKPVGTEALAKETVALRLPVKINEYVQSLPNRSEWLRKAIARQMEEDLNAVDLSNCPR